MSEQPPPAPDRPEAPVLAEQGTDDEPWDWREREAGGDDDERHLRERPPHWQS